MNEPPAGVEDSDILARVRDQWLPQADAAIHLPLGFGAHHWCIRVSDRPRLFVTLDRLGQRHTAGSIEAAYASAADLAAQGLDFVVPSLRSRAGSFTVPLGTDGRLSAVTWLDGDPGPPMPWDEQHARSVAAMLSRLRAATVPPQTPRWRPLVEPALPNHLEGLLATPWDAGPFGARAHDALAPCLLRIRRWSERYADLARVALDRTWLPTHGEPHGQNQLVTARGLVLVDWESLLLAPPERDTRTLVEAGHDGLAEPDWSMVEMFDLEWRLDEIVGYAHWFAGPHGDTADDRLAFDGLLEELERPEWQQPS